MIERIYHCDRCGEKKTYSGFVKQTGNFQSGEFNFTVALAGQLDDRGELRPAHLCKNCFDTLVLTLGGDNANG